MEKYYKIKKEHAERGGFNEITRQEVDENYLMLSEKDIKMISLTIEEKITALGGTEVTDEDIEQVNENNQNVVEDETSDVEDEHEVEDEEEIVEPEKIEEDGN